MLYVGFTHDFVQQKYTVVLFRCQCFVSFGCVYATTPLFVAVWKNKVTTYSGVEP